MDGFTVDKMESRKAFEILPLFAVMPWYTASPTVMSANVITVVQKILANSSPRAAVFLAGPISDLLRMNCRPNPVPPSEQWRLLCWNQYLTGPD